jgi:hypothetical protein
MAELLIFVRKANAEPLSFPERFRPALDNNTAQAVQNLDDALRSPGKGANRIPDIIHNLVFALLSYIDVGKSAEKIAFLFIVLKSVGRDGAFKPPVQITPLLSALMWTFRASAFRQISTDLVAVNKMISVNVDGGRRSALLDK